MPEHNEPDSIYALESHSELDELIRSSTATYGKPASNSELAQRILLKLAAEPRRAVSRGWLTWAAAVPIAACLIAALVLFGLKSLHTPAHLLDQARAAVPMDRTIAPADSVPVAPYRLQREKRNRRPRNDVRRQLAPAMASAQPLPKLDVFPTPQPLNSEEEALVAFALRAPMPERNALLEAQRQPDTPLTIAAIEIQPIELPELGTN